MVSIIQVKDKKKIEELMDKVSRVEIIKDGHEKVLLFIKEINNKNKFIRDLIKNSKTYYIEIYEYDHSGIVTLIVLTE